MTIRSILTLAPEFFFVCKISKASPRGSRKNKLRPAAPFSPSRYSRNICPHFRGFSAESAGFHPSPIPVQTSVYTELGWAAHFVDPSGERWPKRIRSVHNVTNLPRDAANLSRYASSAGCPRWARPVCKFYIIDVFRAQAARRRSSRRPAAAAAAWRRPRRRSALPSGRWPATTAFWSTPTRARRSSGRRRPTSASAGPSAATRPSPATVRRRSATRRPPAGWSPAPAPAPGWSRARRPGRRGAVVSVA